MSAIDNIQRISNGLLKHLNGIDQPNPIQEITYKVLKDSIRGMALLVYAVAQEREFEVELLIAELNQFPPFSIDINPLVKNIVLEADRLANKNWSILLRDIIEVGEVAAVVVEQLSPKE